jgi:hypothetical protein
MPFNWWVWLKQTLLYLYNEILFDHKKERIIDTYYNMDEPKKSHGAKWKMSDTQDHIVYNSIYSCLPLIPRDII